MQNRIGYTASLVPSNTIVALKRHSIRWRKKHIEIWLVNGARLQIEP
jgi:hypothetical protein